MKWKKFKQVIYDERKWYIDDDKLGAKQHHKDKNTKIWNLIGQYICEYYREQQKLDIKFIKADNDAKRIGLVQNTHYVLMLDMSGSMSD